MRIINNIHELLSKKKTRMILLYPPTIILISEMMVVFFAILFDFKTPKIFVPIYLFSSAYLIICTFIILQSDYKRNIEKTNHDK